MWVLFQMIRIKICGMYWRVENWVFLPCQITLFVKGCRAEIWGQLAGYQTTTKVIWNIQTVMILSVGGWYQIVRTPTSSSIIGMSTSTTNANNISPKKVHLLSIQLFSNFLLSSFLNNNKNSFVISSKISRIISHYLLKRKQSSV